MEVVHCCALCGESASLHCERDDAFLCWSCDTSVHSHNSIVIRHTRSVLCSTCNAPTSFTASGRSPSPFTCLCAECSPGVCDDDVDTNVVGDDDDDDISDVSDRMSSTSACGSEKGHMLGSRPRILGAILTREVLEQARASSCAELVDLMRPHFQRRKLLRHTSRRYRKSSGQSSRRYPKDPRFTIQ
ncbi:unnamed protein product [Sphagnum troendelagicum]|uniref:B box-type domain-containing protein n=1 Tax=Sphagnum troendelagicum TaxID=128251 RepID=A0ABP0U499_9BRYO